MESKVIEMKRRHDLWFGIRMLIYGLIIGSISCHWWMYRYHAIDYGNGRAQGRKEASAVTRLNHVTGEMEPCFKDKQETWICGPSTQEIFILSQDQKGKQ